MTFTNFLGEEESTVLLRLNLLLRNGYRMQVTDDIECVWLAHAYKSDLDLILHPCGLVTQQQPNEVGTPQKIRIQEEEHDKFLQFVLALPEVFFYHRIFSVFF